MKKFICCFFLSLLAISLTCCGDSSTGSLSQDSQDSEGEVPFVPSVFDTLMVSAADGLPACNSQNEGRGFFVENENVPYVCLEGAWHNAMEPMADGSSIELSCENGFLTGSVKMESANSPAGNANLYGFAQKGPFLFGASVSIWNLDSTQFYRASSQVYNGCMISKNGSYSAQGLNLENGYVQVSVNGYYRNEVTGRPSTAPVTLKALVNLNGTVNIDGSATLKDSANVNVLTHLEAPRIEQLSMNHIPFDDAKAQAEREVIAAFGIDTAALFAPTWNDSVPLSSEQMNIAGNSEYSAALLAISIMLQGNLEAGEMMNLLNNVGEDLKGDGVWNDPNWKIRIADWVVSQDTLWKYNDFRNNLGNFGINPLPNFEKYIRQFWPTAYGFPTCDSATAGTVTFVNNGQSVFFANDMKHVDHSKVRFICDANGYYWRNAQAMEKDTAGFGPGEYDREIREGNINFDNYYIYETSTGYWRLATAQEADGFTDIGEIYNNLKSDEKVVFIIRHAERTDDTGENGHLTSNGMAQAKAVGEKLTGGEDFYFGYSGFTRTRETAENIAAGRGQSNATLNVLEWLDGSWYVKDDSKLESYKDSDGGGWVVISKYAFTGAYSDAFYDLEDRSEELLAKLHEALPSMQRVNVLCTHDTYLVPLLAYGTNGHIGLRYYEKWKWLNYLAGIAVIYSGDGSVRYVPVKGLDSGKM